MEEKDEEVKVLTTDDVIQALSLNLIESEDKDILVASAKALTEVQKAKSEETNLETKLEIDFLNAQNKERELSIREIEVANEKERINVDAERNTIEKKKSRWSTIGTVLAALIGAGGVVGSQYIKGKMDSEYQDQGYAHEKTENVIWNKNKHRR